jgi:hypothetical protein
VQRDDRTLWRILANRKYRPCTPALVLGSRLVVRKSSADEMRVYQDLAFCARRIED